jgi:perosamine synthetase
MNSVELLAGVIVHSRPWITVADHAAMAAVMHDGMLASGSRRAAFEQELARQLGAVDVAALGSGTAALALALTALDIEAGDEVILPTYVCRSVADAVRAVRATPVLCDVSDGWLMTAADAARHVTPRTRAIVLVHLFGIRVDAAPFVALGIPVVEDSCQAFGAPLPQGAQAATRGAFEVLSFHTTKCLATGEGGAVVAYAEPWGERLRAHADSRAVPAPLSDLQAALGLSQLGRYDEFLRLRREHAAAYFAALPADITAMLASRAAASMFFRFPLWMAADRGGFDHARAFFAGAGIAVRRGVDQLLHRTAGLPDDRFPGAVECYRRTLSIPLWPELGDAGRQRIISRVLEYVGH